MEYACSAVLKFDKYGFAILSESDTKSDREAQDQDERCHIYRYMYVSELFYVPKRTCTCTSLIIGVVSYSWSVFQSSTTLKLHT